MEENGGEEALVGGLAYNTKAMSELRPRHHHPSSPHRNGGGRVKSLGRGDVRLDIRSESTDSSTNFNYAKYGKKKRLKKQSRFSLYVAFIAVCLVYLAFIAWSGSKGGHSKPSAVNSSLRQYYNNDPQQNKRPANPYHRLGHHPVQPKKYKDMTKTPQTVSLNDLTKSIASKKEYIENHAKYDGKSADYGGIEYQLLQNGFLREINTNESAAFDPSTDDKKALQKNLSEKIQNVKGNYPEYILSDGGMMPMKQKAEDASYRELLHYYDDDRVEVFKRLNDGETVEPRACRGAEFEKFYFPTCNNFHEIDLGRPYDDPEEMPKPRAENQLAKVRYLDHGYYRDVWVVEDNPWIWPTQYIKEKDNKPKEALGVIDEKGTADLVSKAYRTMVLKTLRYQHKLKEDSFAEIQLEAIIMERMTKSPRIMDIYGHCGFSVSAELVPIEFEERVVPGEGMFTLKEEEERNKNGLRPHNTFTAEEKLGFALEMAESIADLHGYEDGIIVHDDVQLCQWMTTPDGKLKLGDFNRATIMTWDEINGSYCKFANGAAFGNYRAPEEFAAINLDEQIDTFSFCNNIYALITGLWNFYDTDDDGEVHKKLIGGDLAFVDPRWKDRSYEERKLVELLPKCWAYDPDERISIFDAVKYLRQAIDEKPKHQEIR
eukprot:scaffold33563_cov137-Skeletonema_dohrnii-CCMP3373.AAC.2